MESRTTGRSAEASGQRKAKTANVIEDALSVAIPHEEGWGPRAFSGNDGYSPCRATINDVHTDDCHPGVAPYDPI